jgi:hypothetical protein
MKLGVPSVTLFFAVIGFALAQDGGPAPDLRITKISPNLISSPNFSFTGAQQYQTNLRDKWLEVEVEFAALAAYTPEATFKYFILIGGRLLTGEVTHVNIAARKELRSVMYVPPRALDYVLNNRAANINSVENVAVQVVIGGAVQDEMSLQRARAQWYAGLPPLPNLVLNKNETPFAPLYWDRYAQLKPKRAD